jgi:photosystem II stability/assembly factor-like uncharacterized protein
MRLASTVLLLVVATASAALGQSASATADTLLAGLEFRSIGPAFMSGRIADIAIHPHNDNIWYVAVGSGGVWKTTNAGVTWVPLFDEQPSYSIGCVTIDPSHPHVVWVGTGENVGGRHVGYGDGVYKSTDGGATWKNMGLRSSEHISKIVIHPTRSDVVWVAAQGPLWSKGGERGLFKSTDGGVTWKKTLGDKEWTGATDLAIDPRTPDVLYAATWQRHRTVAAYMGGGPGSGLHRSTDGGETWTRLSKGLPSGSLGKIGLAISPQRPDVLYAAIELDRRTGAVYRSQDRGASWTKMSSAVSGGTGPHYYQELYASPHAFDRIYLADVRMQVSDDGGRTFRRMKEAHKHSDNHALAFRADDPDYLLVGTDGGIYESFDDAENWRFIDNLPVTQFYKVAVDDAEPFYNVYGGTQDNSTQGGPSRTDNVHGIRNSDWFLTLYADGHQPATEPGNPAIMYSEWQQGNLVRVDRTTGEFVYIQPQPSEGEKPERFNWDAPILVSAHDPKRIYYASQRVWRSDDRGDTWRPISGDLTRDQERITLPLMERTWSWDSPWDLAAMSNFNTITSLAESPVQEGVLYAGTDDGIIQATEDGGKTWRKLEVGSLPNVPKTAFVNDLKADLYDANVVYAALDNHKNGDYEPYLLKSTDRGLTWRSIRGDLPKRTLVWRIVQDHVKPHLMFAGTEFGIFATLDGGATWMKMTGGLPTISFRDLAIQRRENDLVGASFGRSFYILDDYSVLREVTPEILKKEATLFGTRKAWWYIPRPGAGFDSKGDMGAGYFTAPNPPFGAVFTYYLSESLQTLQEQRKEKESPALKENASIPFPGWEALEKERRQEGPALWLVVRDASGNVVRRLKGPSKKGFHRVAWDLRYPSTRPVGENEKPGEGPAGLLAPPGEYTVTLVKVVDGATTDLSAPVTFTVERLREGALKGSSPDLAASFWRQIEDLQRSISALSSELRRTLERMDHLSAALSRTPAAPGSLDADLHSIRADLLDVDIKLNGDRSKREIGEEVGPTISSRLGVAQTGVERSTYGPTPTLRRSLEIAAKEFRLIKASFEAIRMSRLPALEKAMQVAGAPWVEGQPIPDPK